MELIFEINEKGEKALDLMIRILNLNRGDKPTLDDLTAKKALDNLTGMFHGRPLHPIPNYEDVIDLKKIQGFLTTDKIVITDKELTEMLNEAIHVYINEHEHLKSLLMDEQKKTQRLSTELSNKIEIINKLRSRKHKGKIEEVLYNLELMDTCTTDQWRITRVPGGWIFVDIISGQNVFVGFSDEYEENEL
jgi:hypothetical protein